VTDSLPISRHCARGSQNGFTLVEVLAALAIFAIAIAGVYSLLTTQAQSSRITTNSLQAQANDRYVMERIVEEAHWADSVISATGGSNPSVTFHVPGSTEAGCKDGLGNTIACPANPIMASDYQVTYTLTAQGTIQRSVTPTGGLTTTEDLASFVTGFTLSFYDNASPPNSLDVVDDPGEAAGVFLVTVGITTDVGGESKTFASNVFLRNNIPGY